jgi:hypothetical protein
MRTSTITLGSEVVVSDPCYAIPTWCQTILTDVLPGRYIVQVNEDPESSRNAELLVIHEDHANQFLEFHEHSECGVDSGQLGIFDAASYRDDATAAGIPVPESDFDMSPYHMPGDQWYEAISKLTLDTPEQYGSYDAGVVSSSGWGDGVYPLDVALDDDGKIVAMQVKFIYPDDEDEDEDLLGEDE